MWFLKKKIPIMRPVRPCVGAFIDWDKTPNYDVLDPLKVKQTSLSIADAMKDRLPDISKPGSYLAHCSDVMELLITQIILNKHGDDLVESIAPTMVEAWRQEAIDELFRKVASDYRILGSYANSKVVIGFKNE